MNTSLKNTFMVASGIALVALLLLAGFWIGRMGWGTTGYGPGSMMTGNMMGQGMVNEGSMMNGNGMMQIGMMNGEQMHTMHQSMMGQGIMNGEGMMGGGMMQNGMMGNGMMGNMGSSANAEPLSLEAAKQALETYLTTQNNDDLAIGEIMIFDNHAYAEIVEKSTGIGAMEVLVNPATLAVTPEHGPNMMWNLKYGAMNSAQSDEVSSEMTVTPEEAIKSAKQYLDTNMSGTQVDDHASIFYGYYTFHILRDGKVVGMISVNGYTQQVFQHSWHGNFIEMSGE